MTIAILTGALLCILVGIAVLATNPERFPNQAFSLGAWNVGVWLFIVYRAVVAEDAGANPIIWLRLNAGVIGFWPWTIWLMKESLITEQRDRWRTILRSLPWLMLSGCGIALCFLDSFAYRDIAGRISRGWPYIAYNIMMIAGDLAIIAQIWRQKKYQHGIRLLEIRFLALNLGYGGLIATTIVMAGNMLHLLAVKRFALVFIAAPYVLSAWAVTVYRVFDARQIFLSIAQRAGLVAAVAGVLYVAQPAILALIGRNGGLIVTATLCCAIVLWLDRQLRSWLRLDGRAELQRMRRAAIEISRCEASAEKLVAEFESLLRTECQTEFVALVSEPGDNATRFELNREHRGYGALCDLGWATPETLRRRRETPKLAALKTLLEQHALGLLIAVPRGSPTPSLLVALGTKNNRGPFTYPEVERLMTIAELMDNILARSRLTTQAALQAKTEHVAMMSRGLAHDLNNLITPISSFLVHIDGHFPVGTVQSDVHGHASRSIKVMQDYVRDAMFFGKRLAPKLQPVALHEVFATVRDLTEQRAAHRGVAVITPTRRPLQIVADALLIQRLVINLTNNAIDACESGKSVAIVAEPQGNDTVTIVVKDEGSGIAPENLSRVFEPYFTTKQFGDEVRGFGLGLSICRKIVDLHHGSIRIESKMGEGTSVIVALPLQPPREPNAAALALPARPDSAASLGRDPCSSPGIARHANKTSCGPSEPYTAS